MNVLSIEHAKYIVWLRYKDATEVSGIGAIYSHEKQDWVGDDWQSAALRILADPEFWIGDGADERVVRAAVSDALWLSDGNGVYGLEKLNHQKELLGYGNFDDAWRKARQHEFVQSFEQQYRPKDDRASRTPIGGDPKDFCECGHHEMNHANYAGMPPSCNQSGCECRGYRPKNENLLPLSGECEGGECWHNPETGYLEACSKHESQGMEAMMEAMMEAQAARKSRSTPLPVEIEKDTKS